MTDTGTLGDRARAALEASASGLTPAELAGALFGAAATRLKPVVDQAAALLERLEARGEATAAGDGRWVASGPLPPAKTLHDREGVAEGAASGPGVEVGPVSAVAVLLAGTRGGRPRLVEAAVVRIEGGAEVMAWSSLANPDPDATGRVRLPVGVLERAGLEPDAFEGAPPATAVIAELGDLIAGTTVVGHDVATVLDALGSLARWYGVAPPYRRGMALVDTEAMARAALPGLARPSLDRVAAALGVPPVRRDRAPERARQVAAAWRAMVARAPGPTGEPGGLAGSPPPVIPEAGSRVSLPVPSVTLGRLVATGALTSTAPGAMLPESPGIYRFHDGTGAVLYVGKATNLRARVAQHFAGMGTSARGDALLSRVATVSHVETACELDAAILEQAAIAACRPPYNVQATARSGPTYVCLDEGESFPRVGAAREPGAGAFGPYRTAADARQVARVVVRAFGVRPCTRKLPARAARLRVPCLLYGQGTCPAPCAPHVAPGEYEVAVSLAKSFLVGGRDAALADIDARLREASGQLEGTGVGSRRWLEGVRRAVVRVRTDARPMAEVPRGAWLSLACRAPGRRGPEDAAVVTFLVRDGRLAGRRAWREVDGSWQADDAPPVEADAARDAIMARRVRRDLGTPRTLVSRWGPPSEAALSSWVAGLAADPASWDDPPADAA